MKFSKVKWISWMLAICLLFTLLFTSLAEVDDDLELVLDDADYEYEYEEIEESVSELGMTSLEDADMAAVIDFDEEAEDADDDSVESDVEEEAEEEAAEEEASDDAALADTARLRAVSAILEGEVCLNFKYELPDSVYNLAGAYVEFVYSNDKDGIVGTATTPVKDGVKDNNTGYYTYKCKTPLPTFADIVTIRLADKDGKSIPASTSKADVTNGFDYSLKQYCEGQRVKDSAMGRLAQAIYDYGIASQIYFEYGDYKGLKVDSRVTSVTVDDMADIANTTTSGNKPNGISGVAVNATCEGDHTMNVTYTLASGYSTGDFKFTLDGKKVTPTATETANKFRVLISNIGAPEIAKAHVITVSDGKETFTVTASLMSYFKGKLTSSSAPQTIKEMSKAIYLYYKAAREYQGSPTTPGTIESVYIRFGEQEAGDNVVVLPDETVTASWSATGDLSGYSFEVLDANGKSVAKGTGNKYEIAANATVPGDVYTLKVGVKPINGKDADVVWTSARFKRGSAAVSEFVTEDTVLVGYNGNGGDVVIPDKGEDGKPILTIGEGVFKDNAKITSVTIGANVTEIKDSSFEGCDALESVKIPNGVTKIGKAAFKNCTSLGSMETYN